MSAKSCWIIFFIGPIMIADKGDMIFAKKESACIRMDRLRHVPISLAANRNSHHIRAPHELA